jgi:hypothetical protein
MDVKVNKACTDTIECRKVTPVCYLVQVGQLVCAVQFGTACVSNRPTEHIQP